jgi:hypothetical protein
MRFEDVIYKNAVQRLAFKIAVYPLKLCILQKKTYCL